MYRKAERDYRHAQTAVEQVECLQKMLTLIPKHKGTDKLQGFIKSKLSEAKQALRQQANLPKTGQAFRIPRQGSGRIVIVGGPNGGKSTILKLLTNANPEIAPFPYTTREPMTAMMDFGGSQVQLLDTPPVTIGQLPPWLLNLVRTADGAILAFDGSSDDAPEETAAVIKEFRNRKTLFSDTAGFDKDDFAVAHVPSLVVVSNANDSECDDRLELLQEVEAIDCPILKYEATEEGHVSVLRDAVFDRLNLIRVYTKPPGKPADMNSPLTIDRDGTVEDLALQIHEDLASSLKHARLWGHGDHDGQIIGRDHVLRDGDVIELH